MKFREERRRADSNGRAREGRRGIKGEGGGSTDLAEEVRAVAYEEGVRELGPAALTVGVGELAAPRLAKAVCERAGE